MNNSQPLYKYLLNPHRPDHPRTILKDRMLLIIYITAIYLLLTILHIGCPIKYMTGISCPGCGMTRAYFTLLHLDIRGAIHYHPLFFLVPLMLLLYLFDFYINPRLVKGLWAVIIVIFLITYLFRLFLSQNDVVEIDISRGFMLKLYQLIVNGG